MDNQIQAGTGAGTVSFTNVPDPASKPLERSAQAESNDLAGMSTQLPSDSQSNKTPKHNDDSEVLTTFCLFCTNSIIIGSFRSASQIDNGKAEELNQVIRNLCSHMQIDTNKLPNLNDYTKIKFPFCKSCNALLETICRYQKIIEAAEATITETVFKIEQIVAVSELGRLSWNNATSSSAGAIEQKNCFPLRNMILEVIRRKFNQNASLSSSAECSSRVNQNGVGANSKSSAEELHIVDQNDVDESSKESEEELPIADQNDVDERSKESEEELPIVDEMSKESATELPNVGQRDVDDRSKEYEEELPIVDQNDVDERSKEYEEELPTVDQNDVDGSCKQSEEELPIVDQSDVDESSNESEEGSYIMDQNDVDESTKQSEEEMPIVNKNDMDESNKELEEALLNEDFIIYDIRQVRDLQRERTEPNSNTQNEPLLSPNACYNVDNSRRTSDSDVIENNEDCSSPPQHDEENYPGSDEIPTPRTEIGNKRRKILINDVRTVEVTCPEIPADYVECNNSDFISISEKRKLAECTLKNNSIMDLHQAMIHAKENCLTCKPLPPVVSPKPISDYKKECDICGRSVRGGNRNLMHHKFTHKNDEEREAALQAGEWGARKTFLSRKRVPKSKLPPVSNFVFTTY